MQRFTACLPFVLIEEGGYVDDPSDHGGSTKWGITELTYQKWLVTVGRPAQPVKFATTDERDAIYEAFYWKAARCDQYPIPVDLVMFDAWVQHRPDVAAKFLQTAVGVMADGLIGTATLRAAALADPHETAERIITLRETFYKKLAAKDATQMRWLNGWLNRMQSLRKEALS